MTNYAGTHFRRFLSCVAQMWLQMNGDIRTYMRLPKHGSCRIQSDVSAALTTHACVRACVRACVCACVRACVCACSRGVCAHACLLMCIRRALASTHRFRNVTRIKGGGVEVVLLCGWGLGV